MSDFELFHEILGEPNMRVRREIVERGLKSRIAFRNIYYEEHRTRFAGLGGTATPALWDGSRLHAGEEAVVVCLRGLADPP